MSAVPEPIQRSEMITPPPPPVAFEPEASSTVKLKTVKLNFFYGSFQALHDIDLEVPAKRITALIGPSGCGKSTFLRTLNRINETIKDSHHVGQVLLDGQDVHDMEVTSLRRRVGMVFQRPNPFPKSIFDNVAYGVRANGIAGKQSLR